MKNYFLLSFQYNFNTLRNKRHMARNNNQRNQQNNRNGINNRNNRNRGNGTGSVNTEVKSVLNGEKAPENNSEGSKD